jgi:hypothetical protein
MKYEYKTTSMEILFPHEPPNPQEPEGNGWEYLSSCSSNYFLYWSWRRLALEPEQK